MWKSEEAEAPWGKTAPLAGPAVKLTALYAANRSKTSPRTALQPDWATRQQRRAAPAAPLRGRET